MMVQKGCNHTWDTMIGQIGVFPPLAITLCTIELAILCAFICTIGYFDAQISETLLRKQGIWLTGLFEKMELIIYMESDHATTLHSSSFFYSTSETYCTNFMPLFLAEAVCFHSFPYIYLNKHLSNYVDYESLSRKFHSQDRLTGHADIAYRTPLKTQGTYSNTNSFWHFTVHMTQSRLLQTKIKCKSSQGGITTSISRSQNCHIMSHILEAKNLILFQ